MLRNVLLVDDEPDIRTLVSLILVAFYAAWW